MLNTPASSSWIPSLHSLAHDGILLALLVALAVSLTLGISIFLRRRKGSRPTPTPAQEECLHHRFFQHFPLPIFEIDLSPVKAACDALPRQDGADIAVHFQRHPDQLAQATAQTRILKANQAIFRLVGITDQETTDRLHEIFRNGAPLQPVELHGLLDQAASEAVCTIRSEEGAPRTVERRILIPDEHVRTWNRALVTLTDITEQARLRESNREYEQQLRQAQRLETIGSLAGGIAHDFNNLLGPIMGRAELLLAENGQNAAIADHCRAIITASGRARDLIRQILTFSRQVDEAIQPVDMVAVIEEIVRLIKPALSRTIEVECRLPDRSAHVMADATQLHQVLMNLVTNSFHAMEDRGGRLMIGLETVAITQQQAEDLSIAPGNYQRVTVRDTGHGMDQRILDKIFDPYFSTKARDKGTGLGLPMALGIIRGYGGEIHFHSSVGQGTTCTLYFPAVELSAPTGAESDEGMLPTGTEHLLLVDDEKAIADVTTAMLERLGYKVTMRISSFDALEAFRNHADQIDLLITDLNMPQMSGLQLSHQIRRIRPDIKIIFCTGFSEQAQTPRTTGVDGFLHKPVLMADLARCVRTVLDNPKAGCPPPPEEEAP
ncbi:MAG: hybrid sensor histidine kinase/response regulator [Desulfobulbus sp.]